MENIEELHNLSLKNTFKKYDEEFKSLQEGENLDKLISEGLNKLANENPLGHVIINIREIGTKDYEKYYSCIYSVEMINLL